MHEQLQEQEDGSLGVWDLTGAGTVSTIGRAAAPVRSLIALAGGHRLASGHSDGRIRLWHCGSTDPQGPWAFERELVGHEADVRALAVLSGSVRRLASGSEDGTIRAWDMEAASNALVGRHEDFVSGLRVLADGRLASASYDGTVAVWSTWDTGALRRRRCTSPAAR